MEKALVSAATGVLSPVIGKLANLLEEKYTRFTGVRRTALSLKTELEHMHAFLEKLSSQENPDGQSKIWMKEVRELSYDIEDSIDKFRLRVGGLDGAPAKLKGIKGFLQRITDLVKGIKGIKARCEMAKEIQAHKTMSEELYQLRSRYSVVDTILSAAAFGDNNRRTQVSDIRNSAPHKDISELVGVEERMDELIVLLTQEGDDELKVVPIVGPGGLGKSTLAHQLYNRLGDKFDCCASVSVSRKPDMMKIMRSVHKQIAPEHAPEHAIIFNTAASFGILPPDYLENATDFHSLINTVSRLLNQKRYFILVDDIWDVGDWQTLSPIFPKNKRGSRIITTTRSNMVAEACCSPHRGCIYKLRPLSFAESRSLFLRRIFGPKEQCPLNLEDCCSTILRKCDGLPLAVCAVSGLLAKKQRAYDQWNRVQNSIGHSLGSYSDVRLIISILTLGYYELPHHLKSCLLYLSIFPTKYDIAKNDIVKRWVAEGFILEEQGITLYESGESCFYELIDRSFIQPAQTNILGEVKTCQVHDIILDFIVSKSLEENFITIQGDPNGTSGQQKKVRRLSLRESNQERITSSTNLNFSHARSVTVFGDFGKLPPLLKFRIIRLLELQDIDLSEYHHSLDNIGSLFHLKYLGLKNTKLSQLPENITELKYLQTLNIKGNMISQLPASIVQFCQLASLLIDPMVKLPDGIGKMQELQELKLASVLEQQSNFVQELGQLTNLRKLGLSLKNCDAVDARRYIECTEAMVSSICKLTRLHSLSIHIGNGCSDSFLQGSWGTAPLSIQRLIIKEGPISGVPKWMDRSLVNLQQLYLCMKALKHQDIQILGGIPSLDRLVLFVQEGEVMAGSLDERLDISTSDGFSVLRYLKIDGSDPRSLGLKFQAGSMPMLEEISLMFKADATPNLINETFGFGMEHLEKLAIVNCEIHYNYQSQISTRNEPSFLEQPPEELADEAAQQVDNIEEQNLENVVDGTPHVPEDGTLRMSTEDLEAAMRAVVSAHPNHPVLIIVRKDESLNALVRLVIMLNMLLLSGRATAAEQLVLLLRLLMVLAYRISNR